MGIIFGGATALQIIRAARTGMLGCLSASTSGRRRVDVFDGRPSDGTRWTRRRIVEKLPAELREGLADAVIDVAMRSASRRPKARGVRSTVWGRSAVPGAFIELGDGVAVSSPEVALIEMRRDTDALGLALVGMELCGGYSLPPAGSAGETRFFIPAVSTRDKLEKAVRTVGWAKGMSKVSETLALVKDGCWSPMEPIVSAFSERGIDELGYEVGAVKVNRREAARDEALATKASRVPDIMFEGTPVGINYDGAGHYDLARVERAALSAAMGAGTKAAWDELEGAKREVRAKYADDRRRERDLWADGLTVFTMTREDLYEEGALDLLMRQVCTAIARTTGRDMGMQLEALGDAGLARRRFELLKSVLP